MRELCFIASHLTGSLDARGAAFRATNSLYAGIFSGRSTDDHLTSTIFAEMGIKGRNTI